MKDLTTVKVGTKILPLVKTVCDSHIDLSYDRMLLLTENLDSGFKKYAKGPNIHTDDAAAKAAGFSRRVVPGIQSYSFISEMLSQFFGMGWITGGKLDLKFIRPFLVGEEITCEAEVTKTFAIEKSEQCFAELAVHCKNAAGDIVSAGSARVRMEATK